MENIAEILIKKYYQQRKSINNDLSLREIAIMVLTDVESRAEAHKLVHKLLSKMGYKSMPIKPTEHDIKKGLVRYSISSKKVDNIARKYSIYPLTYNTYGVKVFSIWFDLEEEVKKRKEDDK